MFFKLNSQLNRRKLRKKKYIVQVNFNIKLSNFEIYLFIKNVPND